MDAKPVQGMLDELAFKDAHGMEQYVDGLAADIRERILNAPRTIYVCEGAESEIKAWFKTINIAGEPLFSVNPPNQNAPCNLRCFLVYYWRLVETDGRLNLLNKT